MKLTATSVFASALALFALACGSVPRPAAAAAPRGAKDTRCDAYASPGAGTAQRLVDSLRPGQTGCLRGGDYTAVGYDGYVLRVAHGGRRRAPIRITSAPGARARLRGIVYVVHGANHFTLSRVLLDGRHPSRPAASQVSIQLMADDATLTGNDITNHGVRSCVIIGDDARHSVIHGNTFHDCGDPGNHVLDHSIYVQSSRGARITNNVFLRSGGWAVQLYPSAQRSLVARNLMWGNGGGVIFGGDGGNASNGNRVVGNVIAASRFRAELGSSFGGPRGRGNVASGNCIAPGLDASDPEIGFRSAGNRVTDAGACLGAARDGLVSAMRRLAPALVARVSRK